MAGLGQGTRRGGPAYAPRRQSRQRVPALSNSPYSEGTEREKPVMSGLLSCLGCALDAEACYRPLPYAVSRLSRSRKLVRTQFVCGFSLVASGSPVLRINSGSQYLAVHVRLFFLLPHVQRVPAW